MSDKLQFVAPPLQASLDFEVSWTFLLFPTH